MGYYIELKDNNDEIGKLSFLPDSYNRCYHEDNTTTYEATISITYNYSDILKKYISGGIRGLYGFNGKQVCDILNPIILTMQSNNDGTTEEYWVSSESNVKLALVGVRNMCECLPTFILNGD